MEESPLHAFELHDLIPLVPAGVDISINKAVILMWVIVGLVAFLISWFRANCRTWPN